MYCSRQAKYDFVNDVVPMEEAETEAELNRLKNESLGMAVLQLSHEAASRDCSLTDVSNKIRSVVLHRRGLTPAVSVSSKRRALISSSSVSFLDCIPKSFAKHIAKNNFLTRLRINRVFTEFLRSFQQRTVERGRLGAHDVMYKYISTLEHLAPRFATETFSTSRMVLRQAHDEGGAYLRSAPGDGSSTGSGDTLLAHQVMVSGTQGIQWRNTSGQKVNDHHNNNSKGKYIYLVEVYIFGRGLGEEDAE